MREKRGLLLSKIYNLLITRNNQQSFNILTIFKHVVPSAHPRCSRDVLVRDQRYQGQERRPTSRRLGRIASIEIFTQGTTFG